MLRSFLPVSCALCCGLLLLPFAIHGKEVTVATEGDDTVVLEEVTVTATREERSTVEVPQAIAVVGKQAIKEKKMFNVKEAIQAIPGVLVDSKNGGFDTRLIIRGAGLKAAYGVREIMVLRDGVPLTDPDSFTRLDFVDTQDIERVEIAKGPGNLFATGSMGGVVQIFSKSVFDETANNLKLGFGDYNTQNYHLRYGKNFDNQALALTATHRSMDNDWRFWNKFDTTQTSLKYGLMFGDDDTLESELSYAEANVQLPGAMDRSLFDNFLATGKQTTTSEPWKNSGRYSKVWFFNSRLEMQRGDFTFKPSVYFNTWYHYHPVTGIINETQEWVQNLGTDLEVQYRHDQGTLVGGLSIRQERTPDSRKYQYRDVTKIAAGPQAGRITATTSDAKGPLASTETSTSLLTSPYVQESWRPSERWIVDFGIRYDLITMDSTTDEISQYDYSTGRYKAGDGHVETNKIFRLPAPKLAVSYKLTDSLHLFGMVAEAGQIPSSSEITSNPDLDAPTSRNYEIGLKGKGERWKLETSIYVNQIYDEIVQINTGGVTEYTNAGATDKKGFELLGSLGLGSGWELGGYYSYTDYRYDQFSEPVRIGNTTVNTDRAGNYVPFIPKHQYGASLGWKSPFGLWARLSSNSWGEYWLDNANTEKYAGWNWVTNLAVGYEYKKHSLTLNVDNIFDDRYAFEVKKDTAGKVTYTAAAPRTMLLGYRYDF